MEPRESMIFYRSFYEAIRDLPGDIQGEIYTAIMEYGLYGNEIGSLKPIARSIFRLVKPQIDANWRKVENGRMGGRPKTDENHGETKAKPKQNQSETKRKLIKNYNSKENYNYNPTTKENSYGAKEKPEAAAMPAGDCEAFGKNPGANPEECEACTEPVEARNPSAKENSGGAARKEAPCGAFDAGAVKSSIEARKARSVAENMRICRESPFWLEATAMLHGMTAEAVLKALEAFPTHLAARGLEEPKSIQEFKSHFNNLLIKQKEQKDGNNRGNTRPTAARAGEGAGTAGGGPAAGKPDRPRPRSVI